MYPRAITYLFVPGNRPERYDKALQSGADVVIVDLEDAVPVAEKHTARDALRHWRWPPESRICVRIHALESDQHAADVECLQAVQACEVMIAKAGSPGALATLAQRLPDRPLLPLIETALGVRDAEAIARAPNVARLAFGALDFALETGIAPDYDTTAYPRSRLALASVLAGLPGPIDGVTTAIDNADALREDCRQAQRFGFRAKLCIHPKQIAVSRAAFAPDAQQVDQARRVLAAAAQSAGAAVQLDGRMVDEPVIAQARQVLAQWQASGGKL